MKGSNILLLSHNLFFICYSGSVESTDWGRWEKEPKEEEKSPKEFNAGQEQEAERRGEKQEQQQHPSNKQKLQHCTATSILQTCVSVSVCPQQV